MNETKTPEEEIADLRKEVARLQDAVDAKMWTDVNSSITGCHFLMREGDAPLFRFVDNKVTIKMDRYAVLPLEKLEELGIDLFRAKTAVIPCRAGDAT